MILAPLWRVEPDAVLARPVVARSAGTPQTLLEPGRCLSRSLVAALSRAGVGWVYVESELGEGIDPGPLLMGSGEDACRPELEAVFDVGRRNNGRVSAGHVDDLCEMSAEFVIAARKRAGNAPFSHDPTRADDDSIGHALAVAGIGLAIGEIIVPTSDVPGDAVTWHLTHLGAGLLLHDIGAVATPPDVLSTMGPLNEMQREMVRWHPQAGEQMISRTVPPHVALVVAQHHEWISGGGYPVGLAGDDIHVNARIAAVADAYDALATRSLTTGGHPSDAAMRIARMWSGKAFDPAVVSALEQVIAPFAPCCPVLLTDGSRGIVETNVPGRPHHPVVRVTHGPDAEPLPHRARALTDDDAGIAVRQVLEHPAASVGSTWGAPSESPHPPSLAIRGLEAGGLLDAPARAATRSPR